MSVRSERRLNAGRPLSAGCGALPHPGHPHQPRLLDRASRGCGPGPRPVGALLPIRERVLGPEHPDTLDTRHNLGHCTG